MKCRFNMLLLLFIVSFVTATQAWAGEWKFGAKSGKMLLDNNSYSDLTNVGVLLGYEIGLVLGDLALEAVVTKTASKGDFLTQDIELDTAALYLAFRTAGPIYFIGRGGYVTDDLTVGSTKTSDNGTSVGIGVGLSLGLAQVELEYSTINSDIAFINLAVQF